MKLSETASIRYARFYTDMLRTVSEAYLVEGVPSQSVSNWLALEWEHVLTSFRRMGALSGKSDEAAGLCVEMAVAGRTFIHSRLDIPAQQSWFERALTSAQQLHDRRNICRFTGDLGSVLSMSGNQLGAIEQFDRQYHLATDLGLIDEQLNALGRKGIAYRRLSRWNEAERDLREQLRMARQHENLQIQGDALMNLANLQGDRGNFEQAAQYFDEARVIMQHLGNRRGLATVSGNLGIMYLDLEDYEQARVHCEEWYQEVQALGDIRLQSIAAGALGQIARLTEQYVVARGFYERALELAEQFGDLEGVAFEYKHLGDLAFDQEQLGDAAVFYEKAMVRLYDVGNLSLMVDTLWQQARIHHTQGQSQEAEAKAQQALKLAQEIDSPKLREIVTFLGRDD